MAAVEGLEGMVAFDDMSRIGDIDKAADMGMVDVVVGMAVGMVVLQIVGMGKAVDMDMVVDLVDHIIRIFSLISLICEISFYVHAYVSVVLYGILGILLF